MAEERNQVTLSASTVILKLDGKILGFSESMDVRVNYGLIPVAKGFGSIMPAEHVITEWSATISLSKVSLKNRTLQQAGIVPYSDGTLKMGPITIELLTSGDSQEIYTFYGCTLQEHSFSTQKNSVIMEQSNWVALSQKIPDGKMKSTTPVYEL